jgi:hypothetical protein
MHYINSTTATATTTAATATTTAATRSHRFLRFYGGVRTGKFKCYI